MEGHIVLSHSHLRRNLNCLLSQVMYIFNCVKEWNFEVQPRLHHSIKFLQAMDKDGVFFADENCKTKID